MRITWTLESGRDGTRRRCAADIPAGIRPEDHQAGISLDLSNLAAFVEKHTDASVVGQFEGTMTNIRAAIRFLLQVAASGLNSLRRAIKRLAAPGTGPFLSGV
jgi:hypothetical protein